MSMTSPFKTQIKINIESYKVHNGLTGEIEIRPKFIINIGGWKREVDRETAYQFMVDSGIFTDEDFKQFNIDADKAEKFE